MKKIGTLLIMFLLVFNTISLVSADTGPKASVELDFVNIAGDYYITLLSLDESTGPYSYSSDYEMTTDEYYGDDEANWFESYQAFRNYEDLDGFYFLEYLEQNRSDNTFKWVYYPPQTFKVLIYFPNEDTFICSDIYERYAFNSHFEVTMDDNEALIVVKNYDYSSELIGLVKRVVLTIVIEFLILCTFGLAKKNIIKVFIVVNIITQLLLNIGLNLIAYKYGSSLFYVFINPTYIILELAVLVIEAITYVYFIEDKSLSKRVILYALIANIISFIFGLIIL